MRPYACVVFSSRLGPVGDALIVCVHFLPHRRVTSGYSGSIGVIIPVPRPVDQSLCDLDRSPTS